MQKVQKGLKVWDNSQFGFLYIASVSGFSMVLSNLILAGFSGREVLNKDFAIEQT